MSAVLDEKLSPGHDDLPGNGADARGTKRNRMSADDEDDDDDKPGRERRKIEIKFIQDKSRRHITFSQAEGRYHEEGASRPEAPSASAYELSVLTGTQVLLLVVSETGLVYTFTTPKLQPLVTKAEGKNLIQACLNAPDPAASENGVDAPDVAPEAPEDVAHNNVNAPQGNMRPGIHPGYMTNEQQQQMAYYQNLQQQQQQAGGQYPMPVGGRMPPQHQPTA
ncbi:hypothetical protein HAV15_004016 [Penicillium sp. str. |nr:hypothetical protein HAV15_004016 [Penicillium sp. str. \